MYFYGRILCRTPSFKKTMRTDFNQFHEAQRRHDFPSFPSTALLNKIVLTTPQDPPCTQEEGIVWPRRLMAQAAGKIDQGDEGAG